MTDADRGLGRTSHSFRRLTANLRAQRRPCCHCGQRIDYTLEPNDPRAFTAEHIKPLSTHPHLAEDPGNLDAAHKACNSSRGTGPMRPALGTTSRNW